MSTISPALVTTEALEAWLLDWHETTGKLDAKLMADRFFTSDVEVRYANNPTDQGKEAVQSAFSKAFAGLDYMHHDIDYFDLVAPDHLYQAATIKYVVKGDDPQKDLISIPAILSAWLVEDDGRLKMRRMEVFLDSSQVFGRMIEKGLI